MFTPLKGFIIATYLMLSSAPAALANDSSPSTLTPQQQSIAIISALTARGELAPLPAAFNEGLDRGLSVSEINEVLIQIYAYAGFPRSLNGIITFEKVITQRQAQGINDSQGEPAQPIPEDKPKYDIGRDNLAQLTGIPPSAVRTGYAAFVPTIEIFLKEHLFADIFTRGVLDYPTRELVTVSALISLGNVNAQLRSHMNVAMHNGITQAQLRALISLAEQYLDSATATNADGVLNQVISQRTATRQ